jgi:hypothetical protein
LDTASLRIVTLAAAVGLSCFATLRWISAARPGVGSNDNTDLTCGSCATFIVNVPSRAPTSTT